MSESRSGDVEARLRRLPGVTRARANELTGNVLVEFDPNRVQAATIVERLGRLLARTSGNGADPSAAGRARGRAVLQTHRRSRRARVAVRGLDRDPDLSRRLVDRLSQRPEVRRVSPSPLTSRVLIEFEEGIEAIQGILDEIAELELPEVDGDREIPAHPLDPGPIVESSAKAIGAALGLLALAARQMMGAEGPPMPSVGAGELAGGVALVQGTEPVDRRIEDILGHTRKELVLGATAIAATAASGNALGLAFTGAMAVRLLTESRARRSAWEDYDRRLGDPPPVYPGAVVTLTPGQRAPLAGRVLEGVGVCSAFDGGSRPLSPGAKLDAGARVYGGSVTVELQARRRFEPAAPRAPVRVAAFERYMRLAPWAALSYAAATLVATRSPPRILTALLLVNPIPALAARECGDSGASARVIRAGVTVVGSRSARAISRPDILVIDEPRTICDGWELSRVLSVGQGLEEVDVLALAGSVSTAAGSPWANLPGRRVQSAVDGTFDGRVAQAEIGGRRWLLRPLEPDAPEQARRDPDELVLVLRRADDDYAAGTLALRPRLARGWGELLRTCRATGVDVQLAARSLTPTARGVAKRAGVAIVAGPAEACVR
ncbi:MAG: hypothetical protein JO363_11025, partial [Solirubrobacterales bacterium]|nr:hypothetical protein [Solirubrobacterales bacterium]